jgi:hypothetical protein
LSLRDSFYPQHGLVAAKCLQSRASIEGNPG